MFDSSVINSITYIFLSVTKAAKTFFSADLIKTCTYISWAFATIGYYCEHGQMVANNFEMLHEEYGRVNWYFLPIEMQKMFLVLMAHNNRLTTIRGYGNILCIRGTFKKVKIFIDQNHFCHNMHCE